MCKKCRYMEYPWSWEIHFSYSEELWDQVGFHFANIHTHGLSEYGHRELCIPLCIDMDKACTILNNFSHYVVNGGEIKEGLLSGWLKNGYMFKAISFNDDPCLYILLPDKSNLFPGDEGCDPEYFEQVVNAKYISDNKMYTGCTEYIEDEDDVWYYERKEENENVRCIRVSA